MFFSSRSFIGSDVDKITDSLLDAILNPPAWSPSEVLPCFRRVCFPLQWVVLQTCLVSNVATRSLADVHPLLHENLIYDFNNKASPLLNALLLMMAV